jgi:hypothetical protein
MVQVDENVRAETTKAIGKPGSELGKNLILLTMLQNHENKTVEMVIGSYIFTLSCDIRPNKVLTILK